MLTNNVCEHLENILKFPVFSNNLTKYSNLYE